MKRNYLKTTIKNLFALSGNECAFPGCSKEIVDPRSKKVTGHICHIRSGVPGGPRYDEQYEPRLINHPQNLILMCQPHHKVIDRNTAKYRPELLTEIKMRHEATERRVDPKLSRAQADEFEQKLKKWCADNEAKVDFHLEKVLTVYEDREHIGIVVENDGLTAAFIKDYGLLINGQRFKQEVKGYPFGVTFKVAPKGRQKIPVAYVDDALRAAGYEGPNWSLKGFDRTLSSIDWTGGCAQSYECTLVAVVIEYETLFGDSREVKLETWAQVSYFSESDRSQPLIIGLNVPSTFNTE
jgi:hypothetical protein